MDTRVLIWIIIAIIVVALVIVGATLLMRSRTAQREKAQHDKAEKLREDARQSELAAREGEARAAQAKADAASAAAAAQQAQARAAQSEVEAQRLADSVGEHEAEATKHRVAQEETLRKADEVDPYATDRDGAAHPVAATDTVADRNVSTDTVVVDRDAASAADGTPRAAGDAPSVTKERDTRPDERITRTPAAGTTVPPARDDVAAEESVPPTAPTRTDRV